MKLAVASVLALVSSASAFTAPTMATRAVGKAPVAKKAAPVAKKAAPVKKAAPAKKAPAKVSMPTGPVVDGTWPGGIKSKALPFDNAPAALDGTMIGDMGFDPFGFSQRPVKPWFKGLEGDNGIITDLNWYREAELMHGRIAQLAVVGCIAPGFGTLSGNEATGIDAYSKLNPLEAYASVPELAKLQILAFMAYLEFGRWPIIKAGGRDYIPGDRGLGQGENALGPRWNPFNFNYTEEEYAEKQLQELKHCRLAMIASFGLWCQAENSGLGVTEQLGKAIVAPEFYAKAGYFFPEGI
jgi:hypothetical protein